MLEPAPLPLLVLPDYVLFPGTLVPFHAAEPVPCRLFEEALSDRRLLVVGASAGPSVAALGRIVSDRRYPDGRIDVFVHALERVQVTAVDDGPTGLTARVAAAPDEPDTRTSRTAADRLRQLALEVAAAWHAADRGEEAEALRAVLTSTRVCGVLANRLGAQLLGDHGERLSFLALTCPTARAELLAHRLGDLLLASRRFDACWH